MSNEQKHTNELLIVESTEATPNGCDQLIRDGKDGEWIAWAYKPEKARRLTAAWNVCVGVPTEQLEGDHRQGYEPWGHVKHLVEQNKALVEALKAMIAPRVGSDKKAQLAAARQKARTLLSQIEAK